MQNIKYIENIDKIIFLYYNENVFEVHTNFDIIDNIIKEFWANRNFMDVLESRYSDRVNIINRECPDTILSERDHPESFDKLKIWLYNGVNDRNKKLIGKYLDSNRNASEKLSCLERCNKSPCSIV